MTAFFFLSLLVLIPAFVGYTLTRHLPHPFSRVRIGDPVIYRKDKISVHPGARARNVWAAENGDQYSYEVDKLWAVRDVLHDGRLVAVTRTGKTHYLQPGDRNLRKAGLIERWRYRGRFPHLDFV